MPRGNPNPSPETRFGGARGNTPGITSEQRQAEIINAQLATDARTKFLRRLNARIDDPAVIDAILDRLNLNALLKDSEDRGLGAPKTSVAVSNPDGSLSHGPVQDLAREILSHIHAKPDAG